MIEYLDEVIKPLVLILPKMSGYVKAFNIKDGNEDKKLTFFPINDEKLLEKYKAIWTKIEDFKNIKLNGLPLYANRHKETKIKTHGDNNSTTFLSLNAAEVGAECESFYNHSHQFFTCF